MAKGSGMSFGNVESMLNNMARNGVIGLVEKEGTRHFYTIPFDVGMFEGQLKRLTPEFLSDVEQYTTDKAFGLAFLSTELPQMRTIPLGKSISVEHHVTTYDHIADIINGTDGPFAILECICRKMAGMKGNPCKKTSRQETCMAIGDIAKNVVQNASGRAISREEALEIARMNEADGLVFQPSNTRKVDFVCACCGCCCGMLRVQKMLPKPVDFWATNYYASANAEACSGCGTCVERCQVDAVTVDDDAGTSFVNHNRCIGCGNCVVTCPTGAMSLLKKEKEIVPPRDSEGLYEVIMANKKGPLGKIKLATKLMFKR
ncbi:MAG TPA: 4Fe-4S dicluster domain-containing protein [Candidatus Bathyarchaeia archaeon]|nr:4Fe-4S dicluster domain-containing protein [Candidatus Bathyarchaeia archaeon]